MQTTSRVAERFQLRSTHSVLRGLTVVVVCAVVIGGFLVQVLSHPAPRELRTAAEPAAIHARA
jgi:hypothetical protein